MRVGTGLADVDQLVADAVGNDVWEHISPDDMNGSAENILGFKASSWPLATRGSIGRNVNSVAGRPSKPPSNFMVGTQRPKSAPATLEGATAVELAAAAVLSAAAAAVVLEAAAAMVVLATSVTAAATVRCQFC